MIQADSKTEHEFEKPNTASATEAAAMMGKKLKAGARAAMQNIGEAVDDHYEEFKETARDSFKRGKKAAREYEASAEQFIQDQPLKTLLIAAGVGIVIGMLITRRH